MKPLHRMTAAVATALLAITSVCVTAAPTASADGEAAKVLLMLDASGSMKDPDPTGGTKMDAAKKALISSLDAIPANVEVGLRVYGAGNDGNGAPGSCEDSQLITPVGPLDKAAMTESINGFTPRGDTPIAYALQQGANDLGTDGKRRIILVSDGEETCDPDPCATVKNLVNSGIDVQIDTVGFAVEETARKQLSCIAEAGGGTYYEAKDGAALEASLDTLGARAARPFTVMGTPVEGSPDFKGAPLLAPGQYTDVSVSSNSGEISKHYKVKRTWPGSTIHVSSVARMPNVGFWESIDQANWDFELRPANDSDTRCDSQYYSLSDDSRTGTMVSASLVSLALDPRATDPGSTDEECAKAEELVFTITRGEGTGGEIPIELRVIEEPPVANAANLPTGVTQVPENNSHELTSPASGTPSSVVGGASFNDATELSSGTYTTELVPGEMAVFKTKIDYGQSGLFAIDGVQLAESVIANTGWGEYFHVVSNVYAPDFGQIDSQTFSEHEQFRVSKQDGVVPSGSEDVMEINQVPEVRYRNRWDSPAMFHGDNLGFAIGGYYYYTVALGNEDFMNGQPGRVNFSIGITGTPSGNPQPSAEASASVPPATLGPVTEPTESTAEETATAAQPNTASASAEEGNLLGMPRWAWISIGGGLVVLGGGGIGYAFFRRRGI